MIMIYITTKLATILKDRRRFREVISIKIALPDSWIWSCRLRYGRGSAFCLALISGHH